MSDQLFVVLRVCLLALVYLVFFRVLRAVWVELRTEGATMAPSVQPRAPQPRPSRPAPAAAPAPILQPAASGSATAIGTTAARLLVVTPPALAGHTFALEGETTIGRGAGCGVAIDDAHISKLHARVYPRDGGWYVEDLGSTNGTVLDGTPITGPAAVTVGGRITIGEIMLELV